MWPVKELKLSAALKHLPAKWDEAWSISPTAKYVSGTCVDQQPIPSVWYGIIGSPPNQKFRVPPGLAQVHIDGVPTAPASLSIRGINDRGDCVGFCRLVNGDVRPFVALVGDDARSFDIQNATITKNFADYACFGINHQREVVGHYTPMGSVVRVGFLADATAPNPVIPKKVFAWLNQNGGQVKTSARSINTAGHIVGSYIDDTKNNLVIGWLALSPGYATIEVSIKRGVPTVIYGINDNLRIVGSLQDDGFWAQVVVQANGTPDVDPISIQRYQWACPGGPAVQSTVITGIANTEEVSGYSQYPPVNPDGTARILGHTEVDGVVTCAFTSFCASAQGGCIRNRALLHARRR